MSLASAVLAWRGLLGEERVLDDEAALADFGRTTLPRAPLPAAVVRARYTHEVVEVLRVAADEGVAVYPISRGNNWGFGDACPSGRGQVVLDLSGMNRILEVNEELAYAVVEPGVTQQQLHEHLQRRSPGLWQPSTGSTPDASVLGNALERGWGHTPYGDHGANICGMEVVLADGTVVRPGFARYGADRLDHAFKAPPGPWLDGLFTQSNLGVVTRVGIWLMQRPEHFVQFVVAVPEDGDLEQLVTRLRPLRQNGTLGSPLHLSNGPRLMSYYGRYPWARAQGVTPLPRDVEAAIRAELDLGAWIGTGAFYGTRRQTRANVVALKKAVGGWAYLRFATPQGIAIAQGVARPLARLGLEPAQRLRRNARRIRSSIDLLRGFPTLAGLDSTRWRTRTLSHPESHDPRDNNCGLFWATPLCPMDPVELRRLLDLVDAIVRGHDLDPLITVTMVNGRALLVTVQVTYDRSSEKELEDAAACHDALFTAIIAAGFPPYRVPTSAMGLLDPGGAPSWDLVRRVKDALDPQGTLAPGRYEPARAAADDAWKTL